MPGSARSRKGGSGKKVQIAFWVLSALVVASMVLALLPLGK